MVNGEWLIRFVWVKGQFVASDYIKNEGRLLFIVDRAMFFFAHSTMIHYLDFNEIIQISVRFDDICV